MTTSDNSQRDRRYWLRIVGAVLVVLSFATLLAHLASQQRNAEQKIITQQARIGGLEQFITLRASELQELKKAHEEQGDELRAQLKSMQTELLEIKGEAQESHKRILGLQSKLEKFAGFMISRLDPSEQGIAQQPKPYSYFSDDVWQKEIAANINKIRSSLVSVQIMDGGGGADTFFYGSDGDVVVDGVFLRSIEIYNLANSQINRIFVNAPGLTNLESNELTLTTDKDIDSAMLDGCLKWKKLGDEAGYSKWSATDSQGQKRLVRISTDTNVQVMSQCDTRYLDQYFINQLKREFIKQSPRKRSLKEGGIGIQWDVNGFSKDGLVISKVLPETPAAQGKLHAGDRIITVDGQSIGELQLDDALNLIRGAPGSLVKIGYIMADKEVADVVETTLVRRYIEDVGGYRSPRKEVLHPILWDLSEADGTIIINGAADVEKTHTFFVRNTQDTPVEPLNLKVISSGGPKTNGWAVLPESTCVKDGIAPHSTCSVIVKAPAKVNGGLYGYIMLTDNHVGLASRDVVLKIKGYVRNVAGTLPEGVRGNGDACPKIDERAEIAVSHLSGFYSRDGYYGFGGAGIGRSNEPMVVTAECQQWKENDKGAMVCENPGEGFHSATARKYTSTSIEGPWQMQERKERHITPTVFCADGLIEYLYWTW